MPSNIAVSVRQRLLNRARVVNRPFNELLQYYAMERFLYRLSQSAHAESFVLKGALLFRVWAIPDSRATRDIDFLAYVKNSEERLAAIVGDILDTEVEDDGVTFDAKSIDVRKIKVDADYNGIRVRFSGTLGTARLRMQIDAGFGDVVHPRAVRSEYPTLLDLPAPNLRLYPPETVIAEKVEAMVHLGTLNSRMKDYYDVWRMSQVLYFDGSTLAEAMRSTFDNRKTDAVAFDDIRTEFTGSVNTQMQWSAFLRKSALEGPESFADILGTLDAFLSPMLNATVRNQKFEGDWRATGPWRTGKDRAD